MCPAVPGRYSMVAATNTPAIASTGSGHQTGTVEKPNSLGRDPKIHPCRRPMNLRKP
jgi:hypothetical protein